MKNPILKIAAVVLLAGYLVSLAGLDIHTCSHTGKTYVSFLVKSLSCEQIHPEHSHAHDDCCHCQHHSNGTDGCCHDESHMVLSGGDDGFFTVRHFEAPLSPLPALVADAVVPEPEFSTAASDSVPLFEDGPNGSLHQFCILRI